MCIRDRFVTLGLATVALAGGAAVGWRLRAPSEPKPPLIDVTPDGEARPTLIEGARRWADRLTPPRGRAPDAGKGGA
jgi:hypothetical protein